MAVIQQKQGTPCFWKNKKNTNFLHKMLIYANALFPAVEQFAWIKHDMLKILYKSFPKTRFC